jgi:hypothetical protein
VTSEAPASPHQAATGREVAIVFVSFLAIVVVQLLASGACSLFVRHFWCDEVLTYQMATDPSLLHSLTALKEGVETHPPAYYLLLRLFTPLLGGPGELSLRAFSFAAILGGMLGLYLLLRRTYSVLVSSVTILAIWTHPLVWGYAFEARFYAPWLAAVVWLAYLLVLARTSTGWALQLGIALCSLLICTIHYFGIISLVLLVGFELLFRPGRGRSRWRGIPAAAAGSVGLLACLPLLLRQRATFAVPTWMDPPSAPTVFQLLHHLYFPLHLVILVLAVGLLLLFRGEGPEPADREGRGDLTVLAGLGGVILLPLVLVLISYAIQPVLLTRYALPATAALAVPVAFALRKCPRSSVAVFGVLFLVLMLPGMAALTAKARKADEHTDHLVQILRKETGDRIIVCQCGMEWEILHRYAPDLDSRCYCIDFEPGEVQTIGNFEIFGRDLLRNHARGFGCPRFTTLEALRAKPAFVLVPGIRREFWGSPEDLFPGFEAETVLSGDVCFLRRKP